MRTLRIALFVVALCGSADPATPHTLTITGNNTAQTISTSAGSASYVCFVAPATNGSVSMLGDSTTSATVGMPISAGAGFCPPFMGLGAYSLGSFKAYVASGDKLSVTWF